MDNRKFDEAIAVFMNTRMNHLGEEESSELQEAALSYKECAKRLLHTLNSEQTILWNDIESAYSLLDGETMSFYYKAGFADAINFILNLNLKS
jgi:hypothetical protein